MSGRKKGGHGGGGGGHAPLWMVSWADMATLLMCFFVLMVSFANFDEGKAHESMKAIQVALTRPWPMASNNYVPPIERAHAERKRRGKEANLEKARQQVDTLLLKAGLSQAISVEMGREGLSLVALSPVFFDPGSAEIRPDAYATLGSVGEFLKEYQNEVCIEGHTTAVEPPPGSTFPTNWELSGARANAVLRYFLDKHGIDPKRMSYAAYGSERPRVPNDSAIGQRFNDRIEIRLLTMEEGEDVGGYLRTQHEKIPDNTEVVPVEPKANTNEESKEEGKENGKSPRP